MKVQDNYPPQLYEAVATYEFPLLFATISGAHLYGFPSPDSDFDLRGVHILPLPNIVGMEAPQETVSFTSFEGGIELDLVTHDVKKFFKLMLRKNGYVLEQVYSPLVVHSTPEFEELKSIADSCITRHHSHHYFGFAETQWRLFVKEEPPRAKPLLYTYRVLLTGINLMRTGRIESNLVKLNEEFNLPYLPELIAAKTTTKEKHVLTSIEYDFHEGEYKRLRQVLQDSFVQSTLPETPSAGPALNYLLKRLRLR